MSRNKKIVGLGLVTALVGIALWTWTLRSSNGEPTTDHERTIGSITPKTSAPSAATMGETLESPPPVGTAVSRDSELNELLLETVLQHIARGGRIADAPSLQRFLQLSIADAKSALALLEQRFAAIPAHETQARAQLFAALLEISIAMKKSGVSTDDFLRDAQPLIERQLHDPERVLLPRQGFTQAEVNAMLHRGGYFYENGQLYANTFTPKYMAMAPLIEMDSAVSRAGLQQIADNKAIDEKVRDVARRHLNRQATPPSL